MLTEPFLPKTRAPDVGPGWRFGLLVKHVGGNDQRLQDELYLGGYAPVWRLGSFPPSPDSDVFESGNPTNMAESARSVKGKEKPPLEKWKTHPTKSLNPLVDQERFPLSHGPHDYE